MLAMQSFVKLKFPSVRHVTTEQLQRWLDAIDGNHASDNIVLLDVRDEPEYIVSHLPGAVRIESQSSEFQRIYDMLKGYRSSAFVNDFQKFLKDDKGDTGVYNIYNLEGSIFKWANEGRNMIDKNNQNTQFVHPFNTVWGQLVASRLRKYEMQ